MSKRIDIERIILRGFGTFVDETRFDLDRGGVNIVQGKNGAGKTTMFSALVWALYQVNLKGSKADGVATWKQHREKATWKGTRVVVYLTVDGEQYAIARHLKFTGNTYSVPGESDLLVFRANEDGAITKEGLVSAVRGKTDTQALVDELLGMDARTFLSSVLFPQRSKRFIEASNDDKRKLLEELFDLSFVDEMKGRAQERMATDQAKRNEAATVAARSETTVANLRLRIEEAADVLVNWDENNARKLDQAEARLKELKGEHDAREREVIAAKKVIEQLGDKCADMDKVKEGLRRADKVYKDALELRSATNVYVGQVEAEITRLKGILSEEDAEVSKARKTCPTCGAPLKADKIKELKAEVKRKYDRAREALQQQEANLEVAKEKVANANEAFTIAERVKEKDTDKLQEQVRQYTEAVTTSTSGADALVRMRKRIVQDTEEVNALRRKEGRPVYDIDQMTGQLTEAIAASETVKADLNKIDLRLGRLDWWIRTGFAAKGVKAYVFHAMLEQLNALIHGYAGRMGLGVRFSVDLTKASAPFVTEVYKDGHLVDYTDLSGGEKQRIDVAMLFALHDLVSSTVSRFNLLIMDEVFEGLDQEGMETAFALIRSKEDRTVYVVSHSSRTDEYGTRKLVVTKENNRSSIAA